MTRPPVEIVAVTVDKLVEIVAVVLAFAMAVVGVALWGSPA